MVKFIIYVFVKFFTIQEDSHPASMKNETYLNRQDRE